MEGDERAAAMARKYVWWQPPERTLRDRRLLLAQMMTLATVDDARWLVSNVSADELRGVLRPPGGRVQPPLVDLLAPPPRPRPGRAAPRPPPSVPASAMTFTPRLDVLPNAQRALWPALAGIPDAFVLYGGTALALRLGHRASVDFDFFVSAAVELDTLFELPLLAGAEVLQRAPDTLTVSTKLAAGHPVRVSVFVGIDIGRVGTRRL